jgi:predicted small lipoprotein YifL
MKPMKNHMKRAQFALAAILALCSLTTIGQKAPKPMSPKKIDAVEQIALTAMKAKAAELKVQGVAAASFAPGEAVEGWTSKMAVVGRMTDPSATDGRGNNMLGIAYDKSAEMARTHVNSGIAPCKAMVAEFCWQGGAIEKVKGGWLIVAFSGATGEQDFAVSQAGLAAMKAGI